MLSPNPVTKATSAVLKAAYVAASLVFGTRVIPDHKEVCDSVSRSDRVLADAQKALESYDKSRDELHKAMGR